MSPLQSSTVWRKILIVGLVIANVSFAWNLIHLATRPVSRAQLVQEVAEMQSERDALQSTLSRPQSDFEKESISRNELYLQNEGEMILQYPIPSPIATHSPQVTTQSKPIILQWWEIVF